ncbi:hypothetical protein M3Y94_00499300 [Aphelenchoides besseyi]|nr:hypothetical protein M3Y94_00499300 [Aphelenchoides besseyi]KAI6217291.1 hypothetical protein M3Y95_01226000 [Aphelenchoides besseyi]
MGQLCSGHFHRAELQMRKKLPLLDYQPQPDEEIYQLDTEVDQKGFTTVNHVFKNTRDVYGQPARDLKLRTVDWRDYGIDLKKRPSPYDFPAFEHEERNDHQSNHDHTKTGNQSVEQTVPPLQKQATASTATKTAKIESKEHPNVKDQAKDPTKEQVKEKPKEQPKAAKSKEVNKKPRRSSHNQDLDHCSLEDE